MSVERSPRHAEVLIERVEEYLNKKNPRRKFEKIKKVSLKAAKIWTDMPRNPQSEYKKAAEKIKKQLTPEIIANPDFYILLDQHVHISNLQLLFNLLPAPLAQFETPIPGEQLQLRTTMVDYMSNIVSHKVQFPLIGMYEKTYEENAAEYIRQMVGTGGKKRFLEEMIRDSGLPYLKKDLGNEVTREILPISHT
ncbi:hypothetical protein BH11PAT1_BH11PAT1_5270 [soil metagenome]